jgi:exopolysaccharide biosynthesis polyprenyl glycosylphosphotransferase
MTGSVIVAGDMTVAETAQSSDLDEFDELLEMSSLGALDASAWSVAADVQVAIVRARSNLIADRHVAPKATQRGYTRPVRVRIGVLVADVLAASVAALVTYGGAAMGLGVVQQPSATRNVFTVVMPLLWVLALAMHKVYDRWSVDRLAEVRRRIVQTALTFVAAVSSACLALHYTALLDQILFGIPIAAALTVLARQLLRLLNTRVRGVSRRRVLVVGHPSLVSMLVTDLSRDQSHDMRVVGACLTAGATDGQITALPVPIYGDLTDVPGVAVAARCDSVIVSPSPELDTLALRRLGWRLHDAGIDLLVAPALSDVTEERIAVRPAGGLPLLHVRPPAFTGPQRVVKDLLDRVAALVLLVVAAPVMLTIAVLVRMTSPGPALFRQRRVGRDGKEFTCLKFRTMTLDPGARRAELAHLNERHHGLLFKIRHDPRVTRLGVLLRRYSLDELPQLFNVLAGDMSLVGPRPPLPNEVANYDDALRRRLLVKPGLTGLWQVSGRSELSWTESVRLDLSYVDNWSPALDARILLRTVAAVVKGAGAY